MELFKLFVLRGRHTHTTTRAFLLFLLKIWTRLYLMLQVKENLTYLLVAWHYYHPPKKCKNFKMLVTLPKYLKPLFNIKMHIYLSLDSISNNHRWIKNHEFIYAFIGSIVSLTKYTCINRKRKFNLAFTGRIYKFWWIILQISFLVCLDETI